MRLRSKEAAPEITVTIGQEGATIDTVTKGKRSSEKMHDANSLLEMLSYRRKTARLLESSNGGWVNVLLFTALMGATFAGAEAIRGSRPGDVISASVVQEAGEVALGIGVGAGIMFERRTRRYQHQGVLFDLQINAVSTKIAETTQRKTSRGKLSLSSPHSR